MGHFGRRPIRIAWFAVVCPALLLNYFGQGALLLARPDGGPQPVLPARAGVGALSRSSCSRPRRRSIASQAVISGAFSLTRQAVQLGYLPRMDIIHTSSETDRADLHPGGEPGAGGAHPVPRAHVQDLERARGRIRHRRDRTMVITTILSSSWLAGAGAGPRAVIGLVLGVFLLVDLAFLGANATKVLHGGWFPLVVGGVIFTLHRGHGAGGATC